MGARVGQGDRVEQGVCERPGKCNRSELAPQREEEGREKKRGEWGFDQKVQLKGEHPLSDEGHLLPFRPQPGRHTERGW